MHCSNCHSASLRNVDGLFFCEDCGTQNRTLRELAVEDDGMTNLNNMIRKSKKGKGRKAKEEIDFSKVLSHRIMPGIDYPFYLRSSALRLTSATYVLTKTCIVLHREFNVPAGITNAALSIFQTYLAKMGVAFSIKELAPSEEESLICEFKKRLEDLDAERKEHKKKRKEEEQKRQELEHSKLSKWQQSFLEQTQVEEEEEINEDHLLDQEVMQYVNTGLAKDAFRMANRTILHMEILLAMIFLGCQHLGCNWILLSDLDRWHREDRFRMPGKQVYNLNIATVTNPTISGSLRYQQKPHTYDIKYSNVCDVYQSLSYLVQVLNIPQSISLVPFEKNLHRLVFDLNLPACFWTRVKLVMHFLPNVTTFYDIDSLRKCRAYLTGDALVEQIMNPQRGVRTGRQMLEKNFYNETAEKRGDLLSFLPNETKAAAVIMLVLKLMFALDDDTENEIDRYSSNRANNFKFGDWLYQTEFRNYARDGIAIENIMSSKFSTNDILHEKALLRIIAVPGKMYYYSNRAWIVPKRTLHGRTDTPFYPCFPADHPNRADFESDLARYASLRFYGKQGSEIGMNTPNIDYNRHEIYLRQFNKNDMDFTAFDSFGPADLPANLASYDSEWRKLFPGICRMKRIPSSMRLSFWYKGEPRLKMDFLRYRLRDESRMFSKSFERLLATMSMLISERVEVLYLAFTMVEAAFANNDLFKESDLLSRTPTPELPLEENVEESDPESEDADFNFDREMAAKSMSNRGHSHETHGGYLRHLEHRFIKHVFEVFW